MQRLFWCADCASSLAFLPEQVWQCPFCNSVKILPVNRPPYHWSKSDATFLRTNRISVFPPAPILKKAG